MNRIPYGPLIKFAALTVVVALATTVLALTIANASPGDSSTPPTRAETRMASCRPWRGSAKPAV